MSGICTLLSKYQSLYERNIEAHRIFMIFRWSSVWM